MPLTTADHIETAVHHGMPVHEVVLLAETDADTGLQSGEARRRLVELGPNTLPRHAVAAGRSNSSPRSTTR